MNKVVLQDNRPTKTISLPSIEGSEVVIYPNLIVSDVLGGSLKLEDSVEYAIQSLIKLIKSWNFTNDKSEDLPITLDNIKVLPFTDLQYLLDEVTKFSAEVKKN